MFAVVRTALSIILLLHSFFGCSVLHACGCHPHEHHVSTQHDGFDRNDVSAQLEPSVAAENVRAQNSGDEISCGCHTHHTHCSPLTGSTGNLDWVVNGISTGCGCDSQPCDGNSPNCHSVLGCSFLHSTDDIFSVEPTFVGFVSYPCLSTAGRSLACRDWQNGPRCTAPLGCLGSLDRCATLSTWQI